MQVVEVKWSPNGSYVAFRVQDNDASRTVTNSGIWVYAPGSEGTLETPSWHVFRNSPPGAPQQDQAIGMAWSPDSQFLLIRLLNGPELTSNVVVPVTRNVNTPGMDQNAELWRVPYQDATWRLGVNELIVSGQESEGRYVIRRWILGQEQPAETYLRSEDVRLVSMRAAAELPGGRIAFLGGFTSDTYALQIMPLQGGIPEPGLVRVQGALFDAQWTDNRDALLLAMQLGGQWKLVRLGINGEYNERILPPPQ